MSVCRPATCLFRRSASILSSNPSTSLRPFHSSAVRHGRRRPHYPSLSVTELAALEDAANKFPEYTPEERAALEHQYTPAQLAALEEAEKAIDPRDLATQGVFRRDHWVPSYLDDFTTLDPFLDKKQVADPTYANPVRYRNQAEFEGDIKKKAAQRFEMERLDGDPRTTDELFDILESQHHSVQLLKFFGDLKKYKGTEREQGIRVILQKYAGPALGLEEELPEEDPSNPLWLVSGKDKELGLSEEYSALSQEIPKFEDPRIRWPFGEDDNPDSAGLKRLSLQTGFSEQEIKRFRYKNLVSHRVVNQTRMGKIASQYLLAVAGNGMGLLGIGEGKATEPEDAYRQAKMNAIRNMKPILRYENRTVYGEVDGKVGAVQVKLSARPPGMLDCLGIPSRCHC
jgi:small subunit ribosomal protein S5